MTDKVVVLDDDPTGTQCVADIDVLLRPDPARLTGFLRGPDRALYVLTNTRALEAAQAAAMVTRIRKVCGPDVCLVLRGDSTLRGHVLPEMRAAGLDHGVGLVVPAFPAAGRYTSGGVHYLEQDGVRRNVADTEFARDPVFGYRARSLPVWIRDMDGSRPVVSVAPDAVASALRAAPDGGIVVPDIAGDEDLRTVADQFWRVRAAGRHVVVRTAPPLAALLAGAPGRMLDPPPAPAQRLLVVCGSHTAAAGRQLDRLESITGPPVVLATADALDGRAGIDAAVSELRHRWRSGGVAVVTSERRRRAEHGSLAHGSAVMAALMQVVHRLAGDLDAVVAKGGITSAETVTTGLDADTARVAGQITAGVAQWTVPAGRRLIPVAVVPGNIGTDDVLVRVTRFLTGRT